MNELTYHQRCFGWASGHYLADEVDKTFWELDYDEQLDQLYLSYIIMFVGMLITSFLGFGGMFRRSMTSLFSSEE